MTIYTQSTQYDQLLEYQNTSLPHIANFENIFDW